MKKALRLMYSECGPGKRSVQGRGKPLAHCDSPARSQNSLKQKLFLKLNFKRNPNSCEEWNKSTPFVQAPKR